MSSNSFFAKFLRFIGIVMMGLTAGFTLLLDMNYIEQWASRLGLSSLWKQMLDNVS